MTFTDFLLKTKENIKKQPEYVLSSLSISDQIIQREFLQLLEKYSFEKVFLVGCGDSYFSGKTIQYSFKEYTGIPTFAENAFEFKQYENLVDNESLVIGISAGGRTSATVFALKEAKEKGAKTVSITNTPDSPITKVSNVTLLTRVPDPFGPPTATTTTAIAVGHLLALNMGYALGKISSEHFVNIKNELLDIPIKMKWIMNEKNQSTNISASKEFSKYKDVYLVGGGPSLVTAELINALMKEIVLIHSEAIEVEEFCHYGMIPVDKETPVIIFARKGRSFDRAKQVIEALIKINAPIYVVTDVPEEFMNKVKYVIHSPSEIIENFAPLVDIIPLQFLSLHWSADRGLKISGFRYGDLLSDLIGYL
ncbi:MAG: SIS domain-containing protein [Candidatus Asgardarchaeia archaeon]